MKILLVGPSYFDTPIYSLNALLSRDHEVEIFDPFKNLGLPKIFGGQLSLVTTAWTYFLRGAIREPFKFANQKLVKRVRELQPDLVFVISMESVLPTTIQAIKQESDAVVIGWFMDAVTSFGRTYFMLADYDAMFFVDDYIVRTLRTKLANQRVHLLPICCDPELHRPVSVSEAEQRRYGCDLTIAGNLYPYRAAMLDQFQDYDLKIWGKKHDWFRHPLNSKHTGEVVFGEEKSKAMRAAKIVLNNNHYANMDGVNKRTFEVAGCGAFQITDAPGIATVYEPEWEIVTFESKRDLKEKVDYYLAYPEARLEIAERAQRRTHGEHTFAHRWQRIVAFLQEQGNKLPIEIPVVQETAKAFAR